MASSDNYNFKHFHLPNSFIITKVNSLTISQYPHIHLSIIFLIILFVSIINMNVNENTEFFIVF